MKLVKYLATHFEVDGVGQSLPKYMKGSYHPVTDETSRHVTLGAAELVDAPADAEKADGSAEKAEAKAEEAIAAATTARRSAEAAAAAAKLAAEAAAVPKAAS